MTTVVLPISKPISPKAHVR